MARRRVAFYGAGHLGRQIYHHVRHHCAEVVEPVGFIDDSRGAGEDVIGGLATLGSLEQARHTPGLGPDDVDLVFTIGYNDMRGRGRALAAAVAAGYRLFTLLHPRAWVEPGVAVGEGSIVLAGAVLDQQVRVGRGCVIDIGVRLTAGTEVGDNNFFCSGTSTGSRVRVGSGCFFGMDCTLTTDVEVGSHVFVNAKTLVARNLGSDLKVVELHKSRELPLLPSRN